jgi:hypothetical protein
MRDRQHRTAVKVDGASSVRSMSSAGTEPPAGWALLAAIGMALAYILVVVTDR